MTIIPLRYIALAALVVFISGCASTEPALTSRKCIMQLVQQVGDAAFAANLICEKAEPVEEVK